MQEPGVGRSLGLAIAIGAAAAAVLFFVALGVRDGAMQSLASPRFVFKFAFTLLLAASSAAVVWRLAQPGRPAHSYLLLVPLLVLVVAAVIELAVLPPSAWAAATFGTTWMWCLFWVPALSLAPLAALLYALRRAAPTAPGWTGAVAGALAGATGATFYAAHCPGDSPLFLLAWYGAAITLLALVGGLAGRRLLRW